LAIVGEMTIVQGSLGGPRLPKEKRFQQLTPHLPLILTTKMRRLSNALRGYQESKESESKLSAEHDGLETLSAEDGTLVGGAPSKSASCWQAVFDPSISATYYYNSTTGESSWEAPEGFEDFLGKDDKVGVASPSKRSVAGAVPLPSIFSLARSALETKKALLRRKHKIVEQIRVGGCATESAGCFGSSFHECWSRVLSRLSSSNSSKSSRRFFVKKLLV
jgi:hypothetical protein